MHDNKNKYTFRKHKAYGLVGAMFATVMVLNPNVSSMIPFGDQLLGASTVHADDASILRAQNQPSTPTTSDKNFTVRINFGGTRYSENNHSGAEFVGQTTVTGTYDSNGNWSYSVTPPSGYEIIGPSTFTGTGKAPTDASVAVQPKSKPVAPPSANSTFLVRVTFGEEQPKWKYVSETTTIGRDNGDGTWSYDVPTPPEGYEIVGPSHYSGSGTRPNGTTVYVRPKQASTQPTQPSTTPKPTDSDLTVSRQVTILDRANGNRLSQSNTTWTKNYTSDGKFLNYSTDLQAPQGYVFEQNSHQTIHIELTFPEDMTLYVVDANPKTVYAADDNLDLGKTRTEGNTTYKGTKPTITETPINFTTRYVKDTERARGAENVTQTEGKAGKVVKTVRHTVNAETGAVTDLPATETRTEPTNKVVKVAAKDKVETIQRGRQTVEKTTVYTVNENTGDITESVSERVVKEITYKAKDDADTPAGTRTTGENNTVTVSTRPLVEEKAIPFETRYEPNPQADRNVRSDKVVGKDGKTIKTTTYTLNKETGTVTPNAPTTKTEPAVTRVVSVGTKPKTVTEVIASPKEFVKDPARDRGAENVEVAGTPGRKETTTTYDLNTTSGVITDRLGQPVTTPPTKTIVKVAAKDKVVTTPIAPTKKFKASDTKDYGSQNTEVAGTPGISKTTTVYTVDPTTGNVTEKTTTVTEKEPTDTIVTVGTKPTVTTRKDSQGRTVITTTTYTVDPVTGKVTPKTTETFGKTKEPTVSTEEIPSPKKFEKDPSRDKGAENITVQGKAGKKVTTTTYAIDERTGAVTPTVGKPVITEPTATIVKVAAKDKVVSTPIESPKQYVADNTKDFGTSNSETAGKAGSRTVTTVYTVNPTTGEITEKTGEPVVVQPTATIIKIGTKPTVVTKKDEQGRTVTETTTYTVDPATGKVTPSKTTSFGTGKEPTVEKKVVPASKEYVADKTREYGQPNVEEKGKDGEDTVTTNYVVDPTSGKVTPTVGKPVRTVDPVSTKVKVAAKDKVVVNTLPSPKKYEGDTTRAYGQPNVEVAGKAGKEVTTTTYTVDSATGKVTEKTTTVKESDPTETIVKVATKPTLGFGKQGASVVETTTKYTVDPTSGKVTPTTTTRTVVTDKEEESAIAPTVTYSADKGREVGSGDVRKEGTPGIEVTRTEYTVDPITGKVSEKVTKTIKKAPVATVVSVPAKDKVVVTTTPKETRFEKDTTRDKGAENVTVEGADGTSTITTTYTVDPKTGAVSEHTGSPVVVKPKNTVVKVALKDKVVEVTVSSPRKYVADVEKSHGTENEISLGRNGKDQVTTVYNLNPLTGEVTESTTVKHLSTPTETIIRVGAKPIVELEKKDGDTTRVTTTFTVDLNTGKVTETKLRELVSSVGKEGAPILEVPEFNGAVNGGADGTSAINEVPEFTDGVGTVGEDLPPVLDVPEFTGGVNGDADGQPAIEEVPAFDLSTLKPDSEYGIGDSFNDGRYPKPVAEDNKPSIDEAPAVSDVEVVPADKKVVESTVSTDSPSASPLANDVVEAPNAVGTSASVAQASTPSGRSAATVAELPNTGGGDNALLGMAGLAIGALGLASLKKKED